MDTAPRLPLDLPPVVLIVLFFFFFGWLQSLLSGWQILARKWRAVGPKPARLRLCYCSAGDTVPLLAFVGSSEAGIYIGPVLHYRVFQRPVLIPWSAVTTWDHWKGIWGDITTIDVGSSHPYVITLPDRGLPVMRLPPRVTAR